MNPKAFVELGGQLAEEAAPGLVNEAKVAAERMLASTGLSGPVEQAVEGASGTRAVVDAAERFRFTSPDDYEQPFFPATRYSLTSSSPPNWELLRNAMIERDPQLLGEFPGLGYQVAQLGERVGLGTDRFAEMLKSESDLARTSRTIGFSDKT